MGEIVTKKISQIKFGVLSPKDLKRMSAVTVTTPELYDADGYPVEKGLMDPMMGVIDPGLKCKTCGGKLKTCLGHYGSIQLARPVIHILYIKVVENILKSFCKGCGRILLTPREIEEWKKKREDLQKEENYSLIKLHSDRVFAFSKKKSSCPYCNKKQEKIKLERPTTFFMGEKRVWPTEIKELLEKIPNEDLAVAGLDPEMMRPEWLILLLLAVPPILTRPSITLQTGDRSEDDLTHKLSDVVRVNQRLVENINAGAPEIIIEDLWDLLQYHVTTFFNNKVSQVPPARHRTNRELKTLAQRLTGKEGRFRHNLAGKRVDFCARSIITPDPNINLNEVGVPLRIAKELTVPECVTEWNKDWLKSIIKNYNIYPGANYVISLDGKRRKITEDTKETILEELAPGWIVERHITNGDIALFNRQPSLHRLSIQGHKVFITPGKTLRINPLSCVPYGADFDGDEMNLHIPQTEEARSEALNITVVDENIVTPRYGLSIIGAVEDSLAGIYTLINKMGKISRKEASEIVININHNLELPDPEGIEKGEPYWTGKQIFSLLLPSDLDLELDNFLIKNGQLKQGQINNKMVGPEGGILIHHLVIKYGSKAALDFLNKLEKLSIFICQKNAYTLSMSDFDIPSSAKKKLADLLEKTYQESDDILTDYKKGKIVALPGKNVTETMEALMLKSLNGARNKSGKIIEENTPKDTNLMFMVNAGAGGKLLHLTQIAGFLGQRALHGKRIPMGYENRTLPHFKKEDLSPDANGFIKTGFMQGMNPIEFFFDSIVGRDSKMDTHMRTPKSGYMQRRLINALQDLKVNYDRTVRDSGQNIIQFCFGGDNVDVSRSDHGGIKLG